ncbi:MAG: DUF4783 domain-containing protein [Bacteroidia bacterium]
MKALAIYLFVLVSPFLTDPYNDISDDIINAVKQGNAQTIAKYFNEKIDLKILDQEDVYSKAQAESVLKDFFAKHKIKDFTPSHSSANKTANQFVVGSLETSNGKYRLSFLIKKFEDKYLISQFRIETENE